MQIPTIQEMKTTVAEKLLQALNARENYLSLIAQFNSLAIKDDFPVLFIRDVVAPVVSSYFDQICDKLIKAHACDIPVTISIDKEYSDFSDTRISYFKGTGVHGEKRVTVSKKLLILDSKNETEIKELIVSIVESIPFASIYNSLEAQIDGLGTLGLKATASMLVDKLNLDANLIPPKQKGRHIVCQIFSINYWDSEEKIRGIQELNQALKTASQHSDVSFGDSVACLCEAIKDSFCKQKPISPRVSFCKGGPLEVHCYKGRYELRFTRKAFEAIAAFIYCYGSEREIEITSALLSDELNAAA